MTWSNLRWFPHRFQTISTEIRIEVNEIEEALERFLVMKLSDSTKSFSEVSVKKHIFRHPNLAALFLCCKLLYQERAKKQILEQSYFL
jgi:hypothetical protein